MFTDEALDPVEFKSTWKKERSLAEMGCQTADLDVKHTAVQSVRRKEKESQTDQSTMDDFQQIDDNSSQLVDFLHRMEPYVIKQLRSNRRSHAFDGYEASWTDESEAISISHTLTHAALEEQLQVTGLSWNCTGSVLAASYGRFDHEDWCTHKACLCTWNVDRRSINPNKPDVVLDLSSCLMCTSFHPKQPGWIAGGTFDGEVMIWDTSKEGDMVVATSGIGDDSHREPVSKIYWVLDPDSKGKQHHLVSVGGDGKILVWQINLHQQSLKLCDGFIILTESLPRSLRIKAKRGDKEMGVTCVAYSHEEPSTFIVGCESGAVLKCSKHTRGMAAGSNVACSIPLHSPVTLTYDGHHGPVYSVDYSPFHRNLFLTCGQDSSLKIYSLLQTAPLITLEPGLGYLFSAKWSPVRPLVFSVAAEDGSLLIYDLKISKAAPVQKLEASLKKKPVYVMQFNSQQHQLLATGDGAGCIRVWKLSDDLVAKATREEEMLDELVTSSGD